jgi:hypothetical protein
MVQYPSAHFPGCGCCDRGVVLLWLQSSWLTMQAEANIANFDGLRKFSYMFMMRGNLLGWDPSGMRPVLA